MSTIFALSKKNLVNGLPTLSFEKDKNCDLCQFGKQVKSCFKSMKFISTSRPPQLFHMDLFGLSRTPSLGDKHYVFVIVDDFSIFTWVLFLTYKDNVLKAFTTFCKEMQNEKGYTITFIKVIMVVSLIIMH